MEIAKVSSRVHLNLILHEGAAVKDSLIAQPVSKVDAFDHHRGPLVALDEGDGLEHILDIAMAPILAFNGRNGRDI